MAPSRPERSEAHAGRTDAEIVVAGGGRSVPRGDADARPGSDGPIGRITAGCPHGLPPHHRQIRPPRTLHRRERADLLLLQPWWMSRGMRIGIPWLRLAEVPGLPCFRRAGGNVLRG